MLVDVEVEHHLQAFAGDAEIVHVGLRQDVGLAQDDGVAGAPLQELAEHAQHVVLLRWLADVGTFGGDHEGDGIHAEARDAELQPEPHDLEDLGLHLRVRRVEVGLEVVETVEIVFLGDRVARPGRFLDAGKDDAGVGVRRLGLRPDVPIAIRPRRRISARLLEPGVLVGRVVDHEIDEDPQAALLAAVRELRRNRRACRSAGRRRNSRRRRSRRRDPRRGLERHQPDRGRAEALDVVEPVEQALEVADAVAVAVHERPDGEAVDDRILVPEVVDHIGQRSRGFRL